MSDNFVTCRHCGVGINYRCDHEDDDVPADEVAALLAENERLRRLLKHNDSLRQFVRHNERCCVWQIGAPLCDCGLIAALCPPAAPLAAEGKETGK